MYDDDDRWTSGEFEFAEAIMNTDPIERRRALKAMGMWDPDVEREWGYDEEDIAADDDLDYRYYTSSRRSGRSNADPVTSLAIGSVGMMLVLVVAGLLVIVLASL